MKRLWQGLVVLAAVAATSPHAQATPPLPFVVVQAEPARDPWWQRATLNPRASTVRGISVKRLEPAWCAAEAFTRELFGEELLGAVGGIGVVNPWDAHRQAHWSGARFNEQASVRDQRAARDEHEPQIPFGAANVSLEPLDGSPR